MAHGPKPPERATRLGRNFVGSMSALLCLVAASVAKGEPIEWVSPSQCPTAAAVMQSLGELIEIERARWDRFERIQGRVVASAESWQLELEFVGPSSTRTRRFRVADCAAAADLAAVTLALALDPETEDWRTGGAVPLETEGERAVESKSASSSSELPAPAPDAPDAPDAPGMTDSEPGHAPLPSRSEDDSPPIRAELGVAAILDPSALGTPNFGVSTWGTAHRSRFSLGVHGDWLPSARLDIGGGGGVTLALAAGGVRGCFGATGALGLCTELEAGVLQASGAELDNARSVRDLWLAPGVSVELSEVLAGSLSIVSRVAVLAPLIRGEYLVNGGELAHRTPPIVVRLALGVALPIR